MDHDVYLNEPINLSEEEDVRCVISDFIRQTSTVEGTSASLSGDTSKI